MVKSTYNKNIKIGSLFFIFAFLFNFILPNFTLAETRIEELQKQINERESAIFDLEKQIAETEAQINTSRKTQNTLKEAIAILDAERSKFLKEIQLTEDKISSKELQIESLSLDIGDKDKSILKSNIGLGQIIREINDLESKSMIISILSRDNVSDFWKIIEENETLNDSLLNHLDILKNTKNALEIDKSEAEKKRNELQALKNELSARKKIVDANKAEKNKLLSTTKSQESAYQAILKSQEEKRKAFEQELLDFESALKFEIDKSKLPDPRPGVLSWPLSKIRITQYFGNTEFSASHSYVYNGQGHNGVDFGASIGTPVLASASGKVVGFGDTDKVCPNASYGKWILLEHYNGLSTLYAHLSVINVSSGQSVNIGDTIGYSGNTGFSTGPHLHFTVYATQGVRIMDRKSKVCGGTYTMPIADLAAYLNPLNYLPR